MESEEDDKESKWEKKQESAFFFVFGFFPQSNAELRANPQGLRCQYLEDKRWTGETAEHK